VVLVIACVAVVALGLVFAGSPTKLAQGTRVGGLELGGLTPAQATRLLAQRSAHLSHVPVTFTAGGKTFSLAPSRLGVQVDWAAAVASAQRHGAGFAPVRGYRRLELQVFPKDISAPTRAYGPGLTYEIGLLAAAIDAPHREAKLVRRGLHITIAPGSTGRALDRAAARTVLVDALASLSRAPVALPVKLVAPTVTVDSLAATQRTASQIIAAPVTVVAGPTRLRIPRWRLATILDLPENGTTPLSFAGPAADRYFARLEAHLDRAPRDANFAVNASGTVRVVPSAPGIALDVPRSAARILAAAERQSNRVAHLALTERQPGRSTAAAQAMGITGTVGGYETFYGGDPNRIHNVQLVSHLVDGKFIAPGATFSFNGATGERSAEKGFLEAPVIINGELQTGLGGGVCQVSTTVFNAAYEAGLPITARTNHALYISHYPLGRDATVNYPDIDLKFVNDTGHWLLLRTFVGPSSLTAALYGTPVHRHVESTAAPLRVVAPPPVKKTVDATLAPGSTDLGRAQGLLADRQAALRPDLVLELPGRAKSDSGRTEEAEGEAEEAAGHDGRVGSDRSALTIASTSQPGTRVGLNVAASTVACAVHPSAINSPSRSIAYS
jgi:vancomycin resistance protein YoaR